MRIFGGSRSSRTRARTPRRAARILVVSPTGAVFLFRENNVEVGIHWVPPGGGIDPGETPEQCALRELREETGWSDLTPQRLLCTWEHDFTHTGTPVRQHEHVYVTTGPEREPVLESPGIHWRWLSPTALGALDEPMWPPRIPDLLAAGPAEPVHLGLVNPHL
ncbi:NUDIX hydrolase [Streptomyces antimicrobicus]|uniref:NUDIX domain-containing protein n=1 Tax=Streptomyces antimicrobicus TaxID=2883108 RepID=A0ABS8B523_9ACTN|nr:NUDIX domain-containing protein [Streptomyces antimicrobicus]MCB5179686.1 NUDIX domain-containing protein [Streptomyces antimicrobicus]